VSAPYVRIMGQTRHVKPLDTQQRQTALLGLGCGSKDQQLMVGRRETGEG